MNSAQPENCKNCDRALTDNYCSSCGQAAHTHRYTLGHIGHEVFHSLTHTDKSALVLLKELVLRPGYVAKDLFEGKRKRYFNLFTFFVISIGIFTISVNTSHYFDALRRETMQVPNPRMPALMKEAYNLMISNSKLLSFTLLPITAFLTWLLFRKKHFNFAEHLVYNTIIFTVYLLFMAITAQFVRIDWAWVKPINNINQVFWLAYMAVGNRQLFGNNWFLTILKTLLVRFLQIIIIWIAAMALAAILKGA